MGSDLSPASHGERMETFHRGNLTSFLAQATGHYVHAYLIFFFANTTAYSFSIHLHLSVFTCCKHIVSHSVVNICLFISCLTLFFFLLHTSISSTPMNLTVGVTVLNKWLQNLPVLLCIN